MVNVDRLKKLAPEERLKVLKDIENQDRQEIDLANEIMQNTEKEMIEDDEMKAKVPIPNIRSVDSSTLFGGDDKLIWKVLQQQHEEEPPAEEIKDLEKNLSGVELITEEEKIKKAEFPNAQYHDMIGLYEEIKTLSSYTSLRPEQRERLTSIYYEIHSARELADGLDHLNPDKYQDLNESIKEMADASLRMAKELFGNYTKLY